MRLSLSLSRSGSFSSSAISAWARSEARGVRTWWAASASSELSLAKTLPSLPMKSLSADTSSRTSVGTGIATGERSLGARCRISVSIARRGPSARRIPTATRSSARVASAARPTSACSVSSLASAVRASRVWPTRTVTQPARSPSETSRPTVATRIVSPR